MARSEVHGFEAFQAYLDAFAGDRRRLVVLFTADKNPDAVCPLPRRGAKPPPESWCDDCNQAYEVLDDRVERQLAADAGFRFLTVFVGDRPSWKDPANRFRTQHAITSIPTLRNLGSQRSISEADCLDQAQIDRVLSADP